MMYGTLLPRHEPSVEGSDERPRSRRHVTTMVAGVALMVVAVAGVVALTTTVRGLGPVVEVSTADGERPSAADFFDSALAGVASRRTAGTRGRNREVSLKEDRHGDVNLNVDIERNGVPAQEERGIKVPIGGSTELKIPFHMARDGSGGVQQLAEEDGALGEDDPSDDDVDAAQKEVDSAKDRVVEDAKRLSDIAQAIKEEQANQDAAQQDAMTREQAGKDAEQQAMDKIEREKAALNLAKKKAEAEALLRQQEAQRANMKAIAEHQARVMAEERAHNALVESEKNKALLQAKVEEESIKKEAQAKAQEEISEEKHEEGKKKKDGAVNMNIKVNVDSPVGGFVTPEEEAEETPEEKKKEQEEEQRQVNMNIVVNVRSPHMEDEGAAGGKTAAVEAPVPPGDEVDSVDGELPQPPP